MTLDDVKQAIEEIKAEMWDDERAHTLEDELRDKVLRAIADGAPNAKELAAEALKTGELDFARWCA